MSHRARPTPAQAFTLIELLVIVTLISTLIALLLPSLGHAKQRAVTVRCSGHLKQQMLAIASYATDSWQALPARTSAPPSRYGFNDWTGILLANDYLPGTKLFACPLDNISRDPAITTVYRKRSYGYNDMKFNGAYLRSVRNHFPWPEYSDLNKPVEPPPRIDSIPTHVLILGENWGQSAIVGSHAWVNWPEYGSMSYLAADVHPAYNRGNGGGNYAFSDGRCEFLPYSVVNAFRADTDCDGDINDRWKWKR